MIKVYLALSLLLLAFSAEAKVDLKSSTGNPMKYFRAEDAIAYSNCVHSITNVQQGGELYGMTWAAESDYHLDRAVAAGCTDGMSLMNFLCTNVLDNAPQPAVAGFPGCTAFMVTNAAGEHLVGRNLDYMLPMAHVLLFVPKNPALNRKYSSVGTVDAGWVGYDAGQLDDGKTDLSYAALFPYYCMDGMNEKGVMVTILALDARTRPSTGVKDWMTEQFYPDRPNVVLSLAIRHLLDNAGTAAEGVQLMENFNVFAAIGGDLGIAGNYHLYICDPSGDTRTVEWMPPDHEGGSWQLREVKGAAAISNFHLTDGYGHGSNRWEIARHAIACREGRLETSDAMNLCRAVAQRKGTDLTSTTHWSVLYNLDTLSVDIATLCHYEEIFPYWFKSGNVAWEIGAAKSVKPSVETELPAYDAASAEAGKVYRLSVGSIDEAPYYAWRPSETGACVSAVNRMGCTYDAAHEPIHVVVTLDGAWPNKAVCYADLSGADKFRAERVVAGVNDRGVSARVARFGNAGTAGSVPASRALCTALLTCVSSNAADVAVSLKGNLPAVPGTGVIFTDATGNVAVWPEGSETVTDDASEMLRYSLDLRQGIYAADGEGRGQFDELPGLMRLASSPDTRAIVSMGYGHLDVMLPVSNVLRRTELADAAIPTYGVIAEPKTVSHATATLASAGGETIATNNQGRCVAETDATLRVVYAADPGYRFADGTKCWPRDFPVGDAVTTPPSPETPPVTEGITLWQQDVYTNRFTIMCETLDAIPNLLLQYGEGYAQSVGMTSTNGLKAGTFVCRAQAVVENAEGAAIPYRLAAGTVPIAGTEGSVRLWKDEDAAFTCAVWGDNQEGVHTYDWGSDVTDERYRAIRAMFRHMKAEKPDFGFSTGDFSSNALYDEEVKPGDLDGAAALFANEIPYHLVWGNHDCNGKAFGTYTNAAQRYFSPAGTENEGWYHLYRNDVLFIGVHWTWGEGDAETRYDAITNGIDRLLSTERAKNAKFRIVAQHAPLFLECYNVLPKSDWFGDTRLLDVAKKGGVDLVLSGHSHAYERIERGGLVQVVNGGMGYLEHGERWYNNYGSDTKVGGHQNTPLLWARQQPTINNKQPMALGAAEPVRMGCFQGYGILSVTNDTLTYKAHAFNADGSYIGVADSFTLRSRTRGTSKTSRTGEKVERVESVEPFTPSELTAPVNNATWAAFKQSQGESWTKPTGAADTDPVVNVSKTEIERFCAALNKGRATNYRLPTAQELMEIFDGDLKRDVSEWTCDVDPNSGWCRILGGNKVAVDYTWCREYDKPAMATADCHANYLGFRVIDKKPVVEETVMDRALAALAEIEDPAEVYLWKPLEKRLEDITADWTNGTLTTKCDYSAPVIFTGKGDLRYRAPREVMFGGGLAAPNATSLDLSHALDLGIVTKPVTVKGEFCGGVAADEWRFYLKCDELTLDNVTYRGQVFNAVTDSRALNLVGTNDFSGAVMSVGIDSLVKDPREKFVTNLVADADATLWLRRLDFTTRNIVEEVIGLDTAGFAVGGNVTLVTTEDVLFGIKGATLRVDGALDAAGVDIAGHLLGLLPQEATVSGKGAVRTTHFGMCDKSTLYLGVPTVTLLSSVPYRTYSDPASGCNVTWTYRAPDYTTADGRDWLYNHAIAGRECPDEAAADSGVDLFYVYPTLVGNEQIVIDGFRGIDDAAMRDTVTNMTTAVGAYCNTARCFADMMHVYAPFYRQATLDTATDCATNAAGEVVVDANAGYLAKLCEGPAYGDVTNALSVYFAKWNKGRKLVLAAHSQGSAVLRLVMEKYFTLPENREKAKQIVCSYQIGFGIGKTSVDAITAAAGVKFAEKADDTNVIVSYNTMGESASGNSVLLPPDTLAINPLSWSRNTDPADKDLNLGALTSAIGTPDVIVPDLYGAQVSDTGANRGQVVVCKELNDQVLPPNLFGTGSLHAYDYGAYWENLHGNCFDRITAATGRKPVVGKPIDYAVSENWLSRPATADKGLDVFYLYPTCVPSTCTTLVGEIDDDMKAAADEHYKKGPTTFESYANVYAPYYRQGSVLMLTFQSTMEDTQRFCSTHVIKTDVFAALDWYFANRNPCARRPFVLASHSQGSANMKNVLEEYFVGEKAAYTNQLVAAYVLGWKITPDWCEKVGIPFATGADDTRVVMTWNAEGPGETSDSYLTADPTQLAINPINWKTDATDAPKAENLGSVITNATGVLNETGAPGVTGTRLQAGRAGAVIVDAPETIPVGTSPGFGTKSYHFEDWGFFHDNIGANGLNRFAAFTDQVFVDPYDFRVNHTTFAVKTNDVPALSGPAGAAVVARNAAAVAVYAAESGYVFSTGATTATVALDTSVSPAKPAPGATLPKVIWVQRKPDYADATGHDWLFNHDIPAKRYAGEPAQDPGVDLFYLYPTSVQTCDDRTVDGVCDIDNEELRGDYGAVLSWRVTGAVYGDFTRVYAPYYRQTPVDFETLVGEQPDANARMRQCWYERAPYEDVTNALTHYFTVINPNGARPFILAGHSHGSGMLSLVMEHFFVEKPERKAWLRNMVACYAIGWGVSGEWERKFNENLGRIVATNATEAGVYVFWNTYGGPDPAPYRATLLYPADAAPSVNPLLWTRVATNAPASLNLGGWVPGRFDLLVPHLYDASNNVERGTIVCTASQLKPQYIPEDPGYGRYSLHSWDCRAYWENLRLNAYQRIETATGRKPCCGTPTDYSASTNWMSRPVVADKDVDVFYLYPTCVPGTCTTLVGEIEDGMKAAANEHYRKGPSTFEPYANVYAPYYRQGSGLALVSDLTPDGIQRFGSTHVVKTDVFAALDWYFANRNPGAGRPFILASHSQGSANMKNVLEEYFVGEKASYTTNLVAAYILGYKITPDWCEKVGVPFASREDDVRVVLTWNAEGPGETSDNFLTADPNQLAINPLSWRRDAVNASKAENLGSVITNAAGVLYATGTPGVTGARLQANRPGAVIVDAPETIPVGTSPGFGTKSYHFEDWGFFHDNIGANGFTRYAAFMGAKSVRFARPGYRVPEGGAVSVRVNRGETDAAVQATLTYVKDTGAYSAAYMDGKKVSFPLTLGWTKDDREPKEILFRTTASARAEADRSFTLQLSAPVGEGISGLLDVCTVTIADAQGGEEPDPYVRALAYPANAGTVSGVGALASERAYRTLTATAKSYATFAGWYRAKADNPNLIDLTAPVEPYSARNPRQIRVGYGTDNAAGTYFAYFTNVLAVASVVEPQAFDAETGKPLPGVAGVRSARGGAYTTYVGVRFALPAGIADDSGEGRLAVSKLPNGLSLMQDRVTGAYRIEGVPTKADVFEAQFVAANAAGRHTVTYLFAVDEMPSNAAGTFYGLVSDDAEGGPHRTGVGSVTFTAGRTGALSAKVLRRQAGTRSFSAKGYDYLGEDAFGVAITNAYGEVFEARLDLGGGLYDTTLVGTAFGGEGRRGTLGWYGETDGTFVAVRNSFAASDGDAAAQQVLETWRGTYEAGLFQTNGVTEVGTVQYRVSGGGSVYVAARHEKAWDGDKASPARSLSGNVPGGLRYDAASGLGGCEAVLRSGSFLWSTEALFDPATRDVTGAARYIRPNAEDAAKTVDQDERVIP